MDLESFKEILDSEGIGYHESGRSLAVEYCPECERHKYKVFFRVVDVDDDEPFFGRCLSGSCQQNYSSFTYLKRLGVSYYTNMKAHGSDPEQAIKSLNPYFNVDIKLEKKEKPKQQADTNISNFYEVEIVPKLAVSKWAIQRGYVPELKDVIRIDKANSAVVFIVRDDSGRVLGYQKRFKTVVGKDPKTYTAPGFDASENILRFKNTGSVVICEGPFTALSAWHWGFDAISTFGSGISQKHLDMINDIAGDREILIAQEKDEAGYKYYKKISSYFHWLNITPKVILPNSGEDLNDSWQDKTGYTVTEGTFFNPAMPEMIL